MGAKWGPNYSWRGRGGATICGWIKDLLVYFAAELRILLVYLSESLGRLGQNGGGGTEGATFFIGGRPPPPVEPPLAWQKVFTLLRLTLKQVQRRPKSFQPMPRRRCGCDNDKCDKCLRKWTDLPITMKNSKCEWMSTDVLAYRTIASEHLSAAAPSASRLSLFQCPSVAVSVFTCCRCPLLTEMLL